MAARFVLDFSEIGLSDIARVGGKNASLGELFRVLAAKGIGALDGFATTADGYWHADLEKRSAFVARHLRTITNSPRG